MPPNDINELRDEIGGHISVDAAGAITEEGRELDDLIDRVAHVTGLWEQA